MRWLLPWDAIRAAVVVTLKDYKKGGMTTASLKLQFDVDANINGLTVPPCAMLAWRQQDGQTSAPNDDMMLEEPL